MIRILGLSGSLRAQSYNTALLRAAQALVADTVQLDIATLHGIPLYDADDEQAHGAPAAVRALKARLLAADGLLLATPEYNNGIPGVFKNGVDWLSRAVPGEPDAFRDRPVALIGASPGGFGTTQAQSHWLPVLRTLGVRFWAGGRLMVPRAAAAFAADGGLQDENLRRQLAEFVQGFASFAAPTGARC
jgi:chromate reductase